MVKKKTGTSEEQLALIDVNPENAKVIVAAARSYKKYQIERSKALDKEVKQKQLVLSLIKEANLQTLEGGKIKFKYDDVTISVTPRDELLKVKEKDEPEEPGS